MLLCVYYKERNEQMTIEHINFYIISMSLHVSKSPDGNLARWKHVSIMVLYKNRCVRWSFADFFI